VAKVEEKQPIVDEIAANVKDALSVVLVDYRGLTVEQDTLLRRELRSAGITYKVYKNTMMNFAFKGNSLEGLAPYLEGPSAIAISKSDATAPARELNRLMKGAPKLEIKAGMVEGNIYDAEGVAQIAKIPAREELISKLLGSLQSPIASFARVISQIAEQGGGEAAATADEAEAPVAEAPVVGRDDPGVPQEETPAAEIPVVVAEPEEIAPTQNAGSQARDDEEETVEEAPAEVEEAESNEAEAK